MAMALASALFSAHAGAMSSQAPASAAFDVISSPQTLTVLGADGAMTTYTFADPELAAVAAPDGMVTVYELTPFAPLSEPLIDSVVFGQNGGITLSGGIGAGVATSDAVEIIAPSPDPDVPPARAQYYQDASRVKLLGSLGVGVTF